MKCDLSITEVNVKVNWLSDIEIGPRTYLTLPISDVCAARVSCTCLVHVLYVSCACPVHVLCVSCTCLVRVLYVSCTCPVRVLCVSCTCPVRVLYVSCACPVRALCVSCTCLTTCPITLLVVDLNAGQVDILDNFLPLCTCIFFVLNVSIYTQHS